jgi:hypothetical protein
MVRSASRSEDQAVPLNNTHLEIKGEGLAHYPPDYDEQRNNSDGTVTHTSDGLSENERHIPVSYVHLDRRPDGYTDRNFHFAFHCHPDRRYVLSSVADDRDQDKTDERFAAASKPVSKWVFQQSL